MAGALVARSGELRERVGFYRRVQHDDGYGNTTSGYGATADFEVYAAIAPRLGGESVLASRLAGTNLVNITIRRSSQAAEIEPDWMAKNAHTGEVYNIRSAIDPDGKRRWIELLCEKGVAT